MCNSFISKTLPLQNIMFSMYAVSWYGAQVETPYTPISSLQFSNEMQIGENFLKYALTKLNEVYAQMCSNIFKFKYSISVHIPFTHQQECSVISRAHSHTRASPIKNLLLCTVMTQILKKYAYQELSLYMS